MLYCNFNISIKMLQTFHPPTNSNRVTFDKFLESIDFTKKFKHIFKVIYVKSLPSI